VTVFDAVSATVYGGGGRCKFLPLYTSTFLLDCVSQNTMSYRKLAGTLSFCPILSGMYSARKTCRPAFVKSVNLSDVFFYMLKTLSVLHLLLPDASPTGVFLDSSLNVYMSEYYNYRITKWVPGYNTASTVVAGGNGLTNNLNSFLTSGIYVGLLGEIYVADICKLFCISPKVKDERPCSGQLYANELNYTE
jgi:hypothetical protein